MDKNMQPWLKVCGITNRADAENAITIGANALGFVFVPESKRNVSPERAEEIIASLSGKVDIVGLIMSPDDDLWRQLSLIKKVDYWQFHGNETYDDIHRWISQTSNHPHYIKAIATKNQSLAEVKVAIKQYPDASKVILDGHAAGALGGSGERGNWSQLRPLFAGEVDGISPERLVLAGGLTPENIAAAVAQLNPHGIDLSSGVEETPGRKSLQKLEALRDALVQQ